ncbi:MAG: hypothetical protein ACPGYX_07100, partial [Oceanobacter sp.]
GALTKVAINLTRLCNKSLREGMPHLELYFLLPTETERPDFRGMRFRSWDAEHQTLRIESSVPEHLIESRHSEAYVLAAIKDAIENAEDFFKSQNISFDRASYDQIIDNMIGIGMAA